MALDVSYSVTGVLLDRLRQGQLRQDVVEGCVGQAVEGDVKPARRVSVETLDDG